MRIIGCDLHARQQTIAMLDSDTGELEEKTLEHQGETVREFYSALPGPILVGIEATGSMQWFLELMEELGIECRVGHPAKIRQAETRKQKHDRRDARLLLTLLAENRFPTIWMPSSEQRDLRTLLRHRHQWVRLRSRVQHTLQSMALNHGLRRGHALWNQAGQHALRALPLAPYASERRSALLTLYPRLQGSIEELDKRSLRRGAAASPGKTIANTSGSGADHRVSHRSVPGRSAAVQRWESAGQLHRHDPERTLQRRPAAAGCDEQTREHTAALSVV
jgi:transposase